MATMAVILWRVRSPSEQSSLPFSKEATDVITWHKLAVATMACSWLPTWLLVPGGKVVGVIALATRGGQLALIGVKLPISAK